jgi:hypothetical protein
MRFPSPAIGGPVMVAFQQLINRSVPLSAGYRRVCIVALGTGNRRAAYATPEPECRGRIVGHFRGVRLSLMAAIPAPGEAVWLPKR